MLVLHAEGRYIKKGIYKMNQITLIEQDQEQESVSDNLPTEIRTTEEKFQELWLIFKQIAKAGLGAHGPKNKALAIYIKLSLEASDHFNLIEIIKAQANHKARLRNSRKFFEPFPHAFRYLRDERWEEEIPETQTQTKVSDDLVKAKFARLADRSWAE